MDSSEKALRRAVMINRVLAVLLIGTVLWNWQLLAILVRTAPWSMPGVVLILLYVLLIGSVIGLIRMSTRGYYFTYILVPFATMFHSVALIPVVTSLLPSLTLRIASVFVLNCTFLAAAVVSHRFARRGGASARSAWVRMT